MEIRNPIIELLRKAHDAAELAGAIEGKVASGTRA
jgi:hypothetical protein